MESRKRRLLISLALISLVVLANLVLLRVIYPNLYQGKVELNPSKTLMVKASSTPTLQPTSTPTRDISPTARPTTQDEMDITCVHSTMYWSIYTDVWPILLNIGNKIYTKEELITLFKTPISSQNHYLLIQLTTAFLNYQNGALTNDISKTITDAETWLEKHPSGSKVSDVDRHSADYLGVSLTDYNNGELGPSLCANEPTSVPFNEVTPVTLTPTATHPPIYYPTWTSQPYIPQPHNPPPPAPTDTPVPPPPPTNTPLPPPTSPPPLPTLAPTIAP